jgi:hypothetical protein
MELLPISNVVDIAGLRGVVFHESKHAGGAGIVFPFAQGETIAGHFKRI